MSVRDRIAKVSAAPAPAPFRRPTGRASYPRRKTIDLSDEQNDWLSTVAYDGRVSAAAIVRAALDYLEDHDDVRQAVVDAAHAAEHPDQVAGGGNASGPASSRPRRR